MFSKIDFPPLSTSKTVTSATLSSISEANIMYVTSVSNNCLTSTCKFETLTTSSLKSCAASSCVSANCETSVVSSTKSVNLSNGHVSIEKNKQIIMSSEQSMSKNKSSEMDLSKCEFTEQGTNTLLCSDSSRLCNSFQKVHIAYCKVRIAALFYFHKGKKLKVEELKLFYKDMFRENFFKDNVLKYYVLKVNSDMQLSELFIQQFCGDFLKLSKKASTLTVEVIETKDVSFLYITLMNELIGLLEKLDLPYNYPLQTELTLLGNITRDVDVYRVGDRNGCFYSMLSFGVPHRRVLSGRERPTLDEINQKVLQIQNKICRRNDVVKVAEIVKELCVFYNVSCVADLCPFESRKIRQETDIPAIYDIIRLQGKINAFILSFVTFRNICTLFELNEEICKMESKSSFLDLKLGPLQKQLLINDNFKFPPNQNDIPHITTSDVFKLIWKMYDKKKQCADEELSENSSTGLKSRKHEPREREKFLFSLPEFMEFLIKQHGFTEPYESGVKISSIALAVSVVKKAKFGDMQNERNQIKYFNDQLRKELGLYFDHKLNEIVRSSRPQNLIEKLCGMRLFDAFKEIHTMLTHMTQEVSKYFCNGSSISNAFVSVILSKFMQCLKSVQQDVLLSRIVHIVLLTAPLKVIGLDDIDILRYLGFDETIQTLLKENKTENLNVKHQSGYSVTPKALVIETAKKWLSQNTDFTIESLFRIERQITSEINESYECFNDLGHGTFLKFLVNNESIKHLVKLNTVPASFSSTYTKENVLNFTQQCGTEKSNDDKIQGLKIQFNVKDPSLFSGLFNGTPTDCVFIYQHAVLCGTEYQKELISKTHSDDCLIKVAVSKINSLPYLEEISQLTNWDEIFQNKLGNLKVFIQSNFFFKDVQYLFLEIQSGKFVKILKDCSIELFTEALTSRDPKKISLCLTSILCLNGQIDHAPLTLLSNRMEMFMQSTFQTFSNTDHFLLDIILECIYWVPFHILCSVVRKMFLSPLSTIYGSQNVPHLLLKVCTNNSTFRNRIHALGFQLHVAEWIEDYNKQLINIQVDIQNVLDDTIKINDKDLQIQKTVSVFQDVSTVSLMVDSLDSTALLKTGQEEVLHEWVTSDIQNDHCHKIINDIRCEQFGIGLELREQEKKLIEIYREREGRSIQRLSNELYSKDSHFVLELIQNADDNQYIENSNNEKPTVAFIVEHDQIIILNNEKGFSESDIKALCDVGKSTKGIHRKGYIGQKGIGFKSVFRVTDMPEIHSNGYHIKFDASSGSNGYILPNWIYDWNSDQRSTYQPCKSRNYGWKTQIVLPLKKEMQHSKFISRFHDIHSSLLLFLNRLHTIIIDDKVSNIMKVMEREHVEKNIVRLSNNNDSRLWFVVEKEIPIDIREDVKSTNIAFAFPFNNKLKTEALPAQQVFAFLPLRSYGFKFIIQADFEVPSSREDIDKDSAWNQYILQQLPKLTVEAFHSFKIHQYFKGLEGVIEYLKFMDLEDNVFGVFKQVSQQMIKSLQREACLPVIPKNIENDKVLSWVIPKHIVFSQQEIYKVISPEILQEKLGLYYLNNDIDCAASKRVLTSLGVCELKFEQLIEVCKLVVQEFNSSSQQIKNPDKIQQWIGKWLHLVYTSLQNSCDCSQKTFDIIRSLHIFPLTNGSIMSLKENVAFFPVYDIPKHGKEKKDKRMLDLIENDLNILSSNLMESLDHIEQEQVKKLMCDLGVKYITPSDLIHNQIIPAFKSGLWKSKPEKLVVAYVVYLEGQYRIQPDIFDITEVSRWVMLMTNKGFRSPLDQSNPIYLTPQYGNEINLRLSFPSGDWTLIDDCYISGCSQKEKEAMLSFMLSLSLKKSFFIRKSIKSLHVSDLIGSCWNSYFQTWDKTSDETYILHDLECPELSQIIDAQVLHEIQQFLLVLDQHWNAEFSKYDLSRPSCLVESTSGHFVAKTYSSLLLKMRFSKWLPDNLKIPKLHQPIDLYFSNDEILSLMGKKVNYLSNQVKCKDLILSLGVQTDIKFESFVKEFQSWREESLFSTSYDHSINIYKYYEKHQLGYSNIINELMQYPFVFLPHDQKAQKFSNSTSVLEGKFFSVNSLCWEDPSGILSNFKEEIAIRRTLSSYYPKDLLNFFVNKLGVNRYPSIQEYINLARSIASKTVLPDKVACEKLFNLFSVLGHMFIINSKLKELNELSFSESTEERKQQYEDLASFIDPQLLYVHGKDIMEEHIFPTSNNTFYCISELPLLAEYDSLSKVFQESGQVPLIFFDSVLNMISVNNTKRITDSCLLKFFKIMIFFKACGIRLLSDVFMEPEITTTFMERGCSKWEKTLHDISPIVQRYLKAKIPLVYEQLCSKDFHTYLQNSTIFTVKKLEAVYRLSDRDSVNISQVKIALVLDAEAKHATVYITSEYAEEKSKFENILDEILNLFVGSNEKYKEELLDFILTYLSAKYKDECLKRKNIPEISSPEKIWHYSEPKLIKYSHQTAPVVKELPIENASLPVENKGLTCWPPRNPAGLGFVAKPESLKNAEKEVHEKWKAPVYPECAENNYLVEPIANQSLERNSNTLSHKAKAESDYLVVNQNFNSMNEVLNNLQQINSVGAQSCLSSNSDKVCSLPSNPVAVYSVICDERLNQWKKWNQVNQTIIPHNEQLPLRNKNNFSCGKQKSCNFEKFENPVIEDQYEDLPIIIQGTLKDFEKSQFDKEKSDRSGHFGEYIVYRHIQEIYKDDITEGKVKIFWLNEREETGVPYDIKIEFTDQKVVSESSNIKCIYIEVKTSYLDGKNQFEISANQLRFAFDQQASFHLYRVTGLNENLRIRRLVNLSMYMDSKSVQLFMVL
ncbi:uncharacterized protein LOC100210004 isoform X4 [Hydra vulgaris]|uniref:Uncharacterized protein LOC100210004 isoform X4 n=1 Tax=Hydra vulgaris TaxID=6087 RepID=A0ABM4DDE3_HYDVU